MRHLTPVAAIAAAGLLALAPRASNAQEAGPGGAEVVTERIFVRDIGPGEAGRVLRAALLAPHLALHSADRLVLPRDSVVATKPAVAWPFECGTVRTTDPTIAGVWPTPFGHAGAR